MPITKAILTGGGRATRLRPITNTLNKHLIPLANEPMIFYALKKVAEAGITDVFINVHPDETELQKAIGDGSKFNLKVTYFVQDKPQGIAQVVNCAKDFIGSDPFMFYLSDNIILGSLRPMLEEFAAKQYDCMLAFSRVPDPERFGIPYFDDKGKLIDVVEKPKNPPNNLAVTGIYVYGPNIFFDAFTQITPSGRGEYEISDIHSKFLKAGKNVGYKEITGWWKDTGKPEDLLLANKLLLAERSIEACQNLGEGSPVSEGKVHIGKGTKIGKGVFLLGPVMIGENCVLEGCALGPNVSVGDNCTITDHPILDNTIVLPRTVIDGPIHLTNSIIGENAKVRRKNPAANYSVILGDHTSLNIF